MLLDEDTSMMDRLGKSKLEDLGLESALKEVLDLKSEHIIELHLGLIEDTDLDKATEKGISFEKTLRVLVLKGEKLTSSLTDLSQGVLDAPHLTLVLESEGSDELELLKRNELIWRTR